MFEKKSPFIRFFALSFTIIFLLNLDFTILRSVRNTLAVVGKGGSASSIPYFELFGVLPAACVMTWFFTVILQRFTIKKVFLLTLSLFISFFILFAFIYPWANSRSLALAKGSALLFYVMAELWKPALINILFWGIFNMNLPLEKAKKLYPPLMLGASLGSVLAGPITVLATSKNLWEKLPLFSNQWFHTFLLLMSLLFLFGLFSGILFLFLCRFFPETTSPQSTKMALPFTDTIKKALSSRPLRLLGWIVIADYIAYSLGEVIFLEVLKHRFPDPCDYCRYMGHLSFWSSILTLASALFIAPFCLSRFRWVTSALLLPVILLVVEAAFFLFLRMDGFVFRFLGWNSSSWLLILVGIGSFQYCVCRAIKYTIFDPAKELAFVIMPKEEQMHGKLMIDGIGARFGRGSASLLSISFISLAGGILASVPLAGIVALLACGSWILSTHKLGKQMESEKVVT